MSESRSRQNFAKECEAAINKQINMELSASYAYMVYASYFDQDNVAFPKVVKFFEKMSEEEREHAQMFIKYQNKRGGRVVFQDVSKPTKTSFSCLQEAMETALEMEQAINASLIELHKMSSAHNDPQLCDYLESEFLEEQVKSIKEFADYVTQTKRNGPGLGEYLFERLSLE